MRNLKSTQFAFRSRPYLSGHHGISYSHETVVDDDGSLQVNAKIIDPLQDTMRQNLKASDFDISNLTRAGATDLLKPCKPISPSALVSQDNFDDGVTALMSTLDTD